MFNKKLQVEKVEMVKKIIRKYDYSNYEQTHKECVEMGLKVNRPALDRFGERLQQMDTKAKSKSQYDDQVFDDGAVGELNPEFSDVQIAPSTPEDSLIQITDDERQSFPKFKDRADEITFELGALRIKENELLTELTSIKKKRSN